jgi:CheY-like chemotaxis protein
MAHILLADDDDCFRVVLSRVLRILGHTVREASDGDQAMKALRAEPAHLVMIELIMPNKEGLETIMLLRKNRVNARIVAMSAGGRVDAAEILRIAERLGADATLTKPFTFEQLPGVLRRLLPGAT